MQIRKVGLMTPGDMGQGVAMQIKAKGCTVCTALDQRSERSRALAREAELADVGTVARLVAECDVVLSVMNPGAADLEQLAGPQLIVHVISERIADASALKRAMAHSTKARRDFGWKY